MQKFNTLKKIRFVEKNIYLQVLPLNFQNKFRGEKKEEMDNPPVSGVCLINVFREIEMSR